MKERDRLSVGVLGGGILGIDIALRLSGEGFKVTILEAESEPGGLTSKEQFGKYVWDKFYHVILPADSLTGGLIKGLGLGNELNWAETKTGFFIDGSYHSMSNIIEFLKFPTLNLFQKFRLGLTILAGSYLNDYNRLEKIPVSEWLIRWSGKKTYNQIWLPLLRAKLGEDYHQTSAAFICATIKRLYGARKKGSKKEVFGYVNGGYARIMNSLATRLEERSIEVVSNFKVKEIHQQNDFRIDVTSSLNMKKTFDFVVSTLPCSLNAQFCPQLSASEINRLNDVKYMGVICVSLMLKNQLTPYYVTNITDKNVPFTGVIEMTSLVNRSVFGGNSLVYLPRYLNSGNRLFNQTDESLKEEFIESLKIMQPSFTNEDIIECKVAKARYVIALPVMEYSSNLPSVNTTLKNFFIINSSLITDGTLNVNETLKISDTYMPGVLQTMRNA